MSQDQIAIACRVPPELHARILKKAQLHSLSVSAYVRMVLAQTVMPKTKKGGL